MTLIPIPALFDNYIWAIIDDETKTFDCVDPGEALPVIQFAQANQLKLQNILLTHHHQDHIGGVNELLKAFSNCTVYGPTDDRIPYVNVHVHEHQILPIGQCHFKILFNPGHTSTHISYYETQQEWLFCGDTLFSAGCGRVFDGTMEELHHSLNLFKILPKTTKICCAHEYTYQNLRFALTVEPDNLSIQHYLKKLKEEPKTCTLPSDLAQELLINPFLRTEVEEVQQYARQHGAASNHSLETFRVLRQEKNNFN